jgi:hypothetical protein
MYNNANSSMQEDKKEENPFIVTRKQEDEQEEVYIFLRAYKPKGFLIDSREEKKSSSLNFSVCFRFNGLFYMFIVKTSFEEFEGFVDEAVRHSLASGYSKKREEGEGELTLLVH